MTINTRITADPHSLNIYRDDKHVGFIQWHKEREPRIVLTNAYEYLTFKEVASVVDTYGQVTKKTREG